MPRKPLSLALCALLLTSFTQAESLPKAAEDKIKLRWNVRPGQRFEYMIKIRLSGDDSLGTLDGTIHFADRVVKVDDNKITQSVYCAGLSMEGTGLLEAATSNFEEMKDLSFERVLNSNGKMQELAGMPSQLLGNSIDLVFPDNEVAPGDTWTDTFSPSEQLGKAEVTYKLVSFDAKNARIEAALKKTETMETTTPYLFIVDRETGRYKHSKGSLKVTTMGMNINVGFELNMISPLSLRPSN